MCLHACLVASGGFGGFVVWLLFWFCGSCRLSFLVDCFGFEFWLEASGVALVFCGDLWWFYSLAHTLFWYFWF